MKLRLLPAALIAVSTASAPAAPGTITATVSSACPVKLNEKFTVTLRISGYTNAAAIDAYQFKVSYPAARFAFVGPFVYGTGAPGLTQQWLSLPDQESAADGYTPTPASDSSVPGSLLIEYSDLGYSDREGGTKAAGGFLISFEMQAISEGSGSITPLAAPGGVTFFDTDLNNAGTPLFSGVSVTAITDADADGLPGFWETAHGLNPADNGSGNVINGPNGDGDGDGLTNLFEYALGMDPRIPNAGAAPRVSFAVNPADGRPYLMLHWRRRTDRCFSFEPRVSTDLITWSTAAANFAEVSSAPAGDGLTENVVTRVLPALGGQARRYAGVRLTVP